jgi:hypothetical protein
MYQGMMVLAAITAHLFGTCVKFTTNLQAIEAQS